MQERASWLDTRSVAENLRERHVQGAGNGTQCFQTRIGAEVVFKRPNGVSGHANAVGKMLLAHSSFNAEASDHGAFSGASLRGLCQLVRLHNAVCQLAEAISVMEITSGGDAAAFFRRM